MKKSKKYLIITLLVFLMSKSEVLACDEGAIRAQALRAGLSPEFYEPQLEACRNENLRIQQQAQSQEIYNQAVIDNALENAVQREIDRARKTNLDKLNTNKIVDEKNDKMCQERYTGEKSYYSSVTEKCTCNIGYKIYEKICEPDKGTAYFDKDWEEKFQALLQKTLDSMPEYKTVIDVDLVRKQVMNPLNSNKTMSQLLIEMYSQQVKSKSNPQSNVSSDGSNKINTTITEKPVIEEDKVENIEKNKEELIQDFVPVKDTVEPQKIETKGWWQKIKKAFFFWM